MWKKLLPIIAILFIIALAISNYFNESDSENTINSTTDTLHIFRVNFST